MNLRLGAPSQSTSGETTFTDPNWSPTKSGLCDGDLFTGTVPEGAPPVHRVDEMARSRCEPLIGDDILDALADRPAVRDEVFTVPHPIMFGYILYANKPSVREDFAVASEAEP